MKKTYIIPQACIIDANAPILTGSNDIKDGGKGTPGAHTEAKSWDDDFSDEFEDEEDTEW